jgi:diguanylate cyclase (GGDEF)-like protein
MLIWALADVFYLFGVDLQINSESFVSLADELYRCINYLYAIGLTLFVVGQFRGRDKQRLISDAFVLTVAAYVMCHTVFEIMMGTTLDLGTMSVFDILYLFSTMYLVVIILLIVMTRGFHRNNFLGYGLISSFLIYSMVEIRYTYLYIAGRCADHPLQDTLYVACIVLIGAAFYYTSIQPVALEIVDYENRGKGGKAGIFFSLGVLVGCLSLVFLGKMRLSMFLLLLVAGLAYVLLIRVQEVNELTQELLEQREKEKQKLEEKVNSQRAELSKVSEQLENATYMDPLMGIYNRKFWNIYSMMQVQDHPDEILTIYSLDLNFFKTINDTYGHSAGDRVLMETGQKLHSVRDERTEVFRMGGDQFLVARVGRQNEKEPKLFAEYLCDLMDRAVGVGDIQIRTTMSIGIASYPDNTTDLEQLMNYAESARLSVKHSSNKSAYAFYNEDLRPRIQRKHVLEQMLQNIDFDRDLEMYYQPQMNANTCQLIGMEALVRWHHPTEGFIPPGEFIPVAEEMGIMTAMGEWITRKSSAQIVAWNQQYNKNLVVGINVSPVQMRDERFVDRFLQIMEDSGAKAEWIDVEITEGIAMTGNSMNAKIIERMKSAKLTFSVDDFGTGYAAFANMINFKFDRIKIAKELVDELDVKPNGKIVVAAITGMAKGMNLRTIAEGVETKAQLDILQELGCEQIQGYYFGKPLPASEFEATWLKEEK